MSYAASRHARYPGGTFFIPFNADPIGRFAQLVEPREHETIEDRAMRALARQRPLALFVFDDVGLERELLRWLPSPSLPIHVLVTTVGAALNQLGTCSLAEQDYAGARVSFERAIVAAKKGDIHGRVNHVSLASAAHNLGLCWLAQRAFDDAHAWLTRSVAEAERGDLYERVDHECASRCAACMHSPASGSSKRLRPRNAATSSTALTLDR